MAFCNNVTLNKPINQFQWLRKRFLHPICLKILKPGNLSALPTEENMEVHHHPDLHHNRKYIREYFLEFIMIFLAVTLGYFARKPQGTI